MSATRNFATCVAAISIASLCAINAHAQVLTPGTVAGTISFTADFVPESVRVNAANETTAAPRLSATTYADFGSATCVTTECTSITSIWTYSLTVEAAGTQAYHVGAIAYPTADETQSAVPFPVTVPAAAVIPAATTTVNISFQPVKVSGTVELRDRTGTLLEIEGFRLTANDTLPWGAGVQYIPDTRANLSPNLALAAAKSFQVFETPVTTMGYALYLIPGVDYLLGDQQLNTKGERHRFGWREPFTAPSIDTTRDYLLSQAASISGTAQLNGVVEQTAGVVVSGPDSNGEFFQILDIVADENGTFRVNLVDRLFSGSAAVRARLRAEFTLPGNIEPQPFVRTTAKPDVSVFADDDIVCSASDCNFDVTPDFVSGNIVLDPPPRRRDIDFLTATGGGAVRAEIQPDGSYSTPIVESLSAASYRLNTLLAPGFVSTFNSATRALSTPIVASNSGALLSHDIVEGSAHVTMYGSVADNSLLSEPRIEARTGSAGAAEIGQGITTGQSTPALVGEVRILLPTGRDTYTLTFSALVDGSRVDFGNVQVDAEDGDNIVFGLLSELSLTVHEPGNGDVFEIGETIHVVGGATDNTAVTGVTVNGTPASLIPESGPGDVSFAETVTASSVVGDFDLVIAASDGTDTVSETVTVKIVDRLAVVSSALDCLWPPNHKFVEVPIEVTPGPGTSADYCAIIGVTSNEPLNGKGDGNTDVDWAFSGAPNDLIVKLRAERSGLGNGRIYTVKAGCFDSTDHLTSEGSIAICVPHDQRNKKK